MKVIILMVICFVCIASLSIPVLAEQQCTIADFGPLTLKIDETVKLCVNNRFGDTTVKVGIATYSTFDTRTPVDLQFKSLEPRIGFCVSPNLAFAL